MTQHIIPENHSRTPHTETAACWCRPIKRYGEKQLDEVWIHRGELLTNDESRMYHSDDTSFLGEDR